jgi:hypothetical protein
MGEIWSCVQPRTKLDGVLTDKEREELLEIYETLKFDRSNPVKIGKFRTQLYYVLNERKKRLQLTANLWEDWQELNRHWRHALEKQPDQEQLMDKLSFLHLWKSYGSSKRHSWPGTCCSIERRASPLADYDEHRWRLSEVERKLSN